jgi:hypothetical protein
VVPHTAPLSERMGVGSVDTMDGVSGARGPFKTHSHHLHSQAEVKTAMDDLLGTGNPSLTIGCNNGKLELIVPVNVPRCPRVDRISCGRAKVSYVTVLECHTL